VAGGASASHPTVSSVLATFASPSGTYLPYEELHAEALKYFATGAMDKALVVWERILQEHNAYDMLAIKASHDTYYFLGQFEAMKQSIERIFERWTTKAQESSNSDIQFITTSYGYLCGMYSFGTLTIIFV